MRKTLVVALVLFLVGCGENPMELTEEQKQAITREISTATEEFWKAWADVDVDSGMAMIGEEAIAVTSRGTLLVGKTNIDDAWRPMFQSVASQQIQFTESYVTVLAMDAAYAVQRGTFVVTDTSDSVGEPIPFAYTTVWQRVEDGWKVVVGHRTPGQSASTN